MGKRLAGPPLALLVLLLAVEALFSISGLQVQYVEVWLVLAMVPLALLFTQGSKAPKTCTKKVVTHDRDETVSDDGPSSPVSKKDRIGHVAPSKMSQRARKQERVHSFADAARADEKAQIEACVKAGDLVAAEAKLALLAENNNAD